MDTATFTKEIEQINAEFDIRQHPFIKAVEAGTATQAQLQQYCINQYEITVRDSALFTAHGFLQLWNIDRQAAAAMAENFAEEATGIGSKTSAHDELLFEFWEQGLKCSRKTLINSMGTDEAQLCNALNWRLVFANAPHLRGRHRRRPSAGHSSFRLRRPTAPASAARLRL